MPSCKTVRFAVIAVAVAGIAGLIGFAALAQQKPVGVTPKRHLKIERPAHLSTADALAIYAEIADQMARGYGGADNPAAGEYLKWRQYNKAPFRSATHGNRYVNNYGNGLADDYVKMDSTVRMPAGAVLAKDSFTVTPKGRSGVGPFFLMEKMAKGFLKASGDWRYTLILPSGQVVGTTNGRGSGNVKFCIECHVAVAGEQDSMFFLPEEFRR